MDFEILGFLALFGFIGAFIDAAVGGGGLITIPALMWTGLPPVTVLGTNKVAASMGSISSFITFVRAGKMDIELMKKLCPLSLIGSFAGVILVQHISSEFLRPLIIVMLVLVFLYTVFKKDWGKDSKPQELTTKKLIICLIMAFSLGFYDGFFGPGTGSFILFSFIMIGYDFIFATGNAKAMNFASNIAAAILFSYYGSVDFTYAIPMGVFMALGAIAGSKMAISKGVSYIRPMFIIITAVLIGKQIMTMFG
ncbi:putative membrane protein YfcA [Anaerovibrio sp. JC8]|uniref:TSUP family transporter n=1 Tax=Anaerovibrio sp. JC8 TaxID=1240085 RepID=UPI000A0D0265|nr:TSUP family transporter [Anaerovibrio sp. JC8]ORU00134.1 putative membrane protein YfcA [Anaerovibrio sp. JC8]